MGIRRIRLLLLAYGIVAALVGVLIFAHTTEGSVHLIGARQDGIRNSISVLDRGGPPLLSSLAGQPSPTEAGDDPGILLYLPLLGHAFGTSDPLGLLKWFFVGAFALLLAAYPLLWFEVLSSVAAAIVAPLLVLLQFRFLAINDIYWVPAWSLLFCLPLLALVYQRWGRAGLPHLVAVMLVASVASSIRSQAGLPLFLAAAIVVLLRVRGLFQRIAFIAVLAVAYTAISGAAMQQIRHHRDQAAGEDLTARYSTGHGLWHPAYLGLSFLPNDYGIRWDDQVAIQAAREKKPSAEYLSPEYERTIRSLYLEVVKDDPGFALRVYLSKTAVVLWHGFSRFWLAFLVLPAALIVPSRVRAELRLLALLLVPGILLGAVPPILSMPFREYELAWLGAWGFAWLLVMLWITALVPWPSVAVAMRTGVSSLLRPRLRRRPLGAVLQTAVGQRGIRPAAAAAVSRRSVRLSLTILLAVSLLFLGLNPVVRSVGATSYYQRSQTDLVRAPVRHGPVLTAWSFGKPQGWTLAENTQVSRYPGQWSVQTTGRRWSYQLLSPRLALPPGAYALLVDGTVQTGGLDLAVLDVSKGSFIVQNLYSSEQRETPTNFDNGRMLAPFELASNTRIQIILSNWTNTDASSRWLLRRVSLVRQEQPCGCSPPTSNAWISP